MKGMIVHVHLPKTDETWNTESVRELDMLAYTAGYSVVETLSVNSSQIFAGTFMSQNMADEIKMKIEAKDEEFPDEPIEAIFFNGELSPSQLFKLEKIWGKLIIDRVEMILRIFEMNAQTVAAKIQVEMAQLEYSLPRLKRMWKHLSRIEGGIGFSKGQGETQIEVDRRIVKNRLHALKQKLKKVALNEDVKSRKRYKNSVAHLSLVGYTNAGKTSLMNVLAKEKLYAEDKLFATLSPVTRKVYLNEEYSILLSDTVGFISHLPHFLVESFKATLQTTVKSDLLIIVQDANSAMIDKQLEVVDGILEELGNQDKDTLLVFSKSDLMEEEKQDHLQILYPQAIFISSHRKIGIEELKLKILETISKRSIII